MRISDWSSDVCSSDLILHGPRAERGGRERDADDGEDAVGGAADRVEVEKDEREDLRRLAMDIVLDHHLQAEAQMPEDVGDHQDQRERDGRVRCPAQHRGVIAERQAEHRDDEPGDEQDVAERGRSEEHTSELQSLMRISYAVFCLKKKKIVTKQSRRKIQRQTQNTS